MPFRLSLLATALFAVITASLCTTFAADLQPFAIPAQSPTSAVLPDLRFWNEKPAGAKGPVTVGGDGHFRYDGKRLRLLGMVMGSPARADMKMQAERLARWGFNAARIHGHDKSLCESATSTTSRQLNPTVLDNVHYWVNCLAEQGIYSDINLLVIRRFKAGDGLGPEVESMYWKYQHALGFFMDEALALHKEFATQYLTAANPYRNNTPLALDPAVAMVEINNENGLIGLWYDHVIENMPAVYQARLQARWNTWLKARYADKAALYQAWGAIDEPLGSNFLVNGDFSQGADGFQSWQLWTTTEVESTKTLTKDFNGANAYRVDITKSPSWDSGVQLNRLQLSLQQGKSYTVSFWAKTADDSRKARAVILGDISPWTQISMYTTIQGTTWKKYSRAFRMNQTDPRSRVAFMLGGGPGSVWIADVQICTGGQLGILASGESLTDGTIGMPVWNDPETIPGKLTDWILFLSELEKNYWTTMAAHVRAMGFKSVIEGSTMNTSPANLQADCDASDRHAYWQHPAQGPNYVNGTDLTDWTQEPKAMVNFPETSKAREIALSQVAGRPNTVSEYGHPMPNPYANEGPIFGPAYAALQDTDGLWFHSFNGSSRQFAAGSFDHFGSMSMLANTIIGAALYRRDVSAARNEYVLPMTPAREREILRTKGSRWDIATAKELGMPATLGLVSRTRISIGDNATGLAIPPAAPTGPVYTSDTEQLRWDVTKPDAGILTVNTDKTKVFAGFGAGIRSELDGVAITTGATRLNWCTIGVTLLEGTAFADKSSGRALIVTTGDYANTGWVWKDATKTSITNWGSAPFLTEIIPGEVELPVAASRVKAWALSGEGIRLAELPVTAKSGHAAITIGTVGNTLWYEVQISAAPPTIPVVTTTLPTTSSATSGHDVSFTATVSGWPAPAIQWQVSTDSGTTWANLTNSSTYSGIATDTLTIANTPSSLNGYKYRYTATNTAGTITGSPTTLNVAPAVFAKPLSIAVSATGDLYIADETNNTIQKIATASGAVSLLAGSNGNPGSTDGTGSSALFRAPAGLTLDSSGNLFVADTGNSTIRKITPAGVVSTVAGSASASGSADGAATAARFTTPADLCINTSGTLFIADTGNHTIRQITSSGTVSTLAGLALSPGSADGSGNAARFSSPSGIILSTGGTLVIADTTYNTLRTLSETTVATLAGTYGVTGFTDGTGFDALFSGPTGIAADTSGNLYLADTQNSTIRKIVLSTGAVSTLAGLPGVAGLKDGIGSDAWFNKPRDVAIDSTGSTLYVADTGNAAIRKISLTTGAVSTLALAASSSGSSSSSSSSGASSSSSSSSSSSGSPGGSGGGGGGGAMGTPFIIGLLALSVFRATRIYKKTRLDL